MKIITDIAREFRIYLAANFDYRHEAADHFGCSHQFISNVARGKKGPNKAMLEAMGVKKEKQIVYKK